MKFVFIFLGVLGLITVVGLGIYLSLGISADSKEVIKEIQIKRNA